MKICKKRSFLRCQRSSASLRKAIILAILIPLIFGFLLVGRAASGAGAFTGIRSANKVIAPSFPSFGAAKFQFSFMPFRPTFQPLGPLHARAAFAWNFFDP